MSQPAPLDPQDVVDLLTRYDRPAPRYTSYPTALDFRDVAPSVAEDRLSALDAAPDEPLSVYVHLPFCLERCWFCGCHVVISPDVRRAEPYLDWVRREIDLVARRLPHRQRLGQLHFGGGTPTYFDPAALAALAGHVFAAFKPDSGAEIAIEVDPRVTTPEHLHVLAAIGFNRVSFGVQDLEPAVQQAIGRVQSADAVASLVHTALAAGYTGINADLIYGLPHQTPTSIAQTVDRVLDMGIHRSALYSFAYLPDGRGHQKHIEPEMLPEGVAKLRLFAAARERFLARGFRTIGMDHFAQPTDELAIARQERRLRRNFQGYTTLPSADVLGFGVSAIGDVRGALLQNEKKLNRYQEAIDAGRLATYRGVQRSADDVLRGRIISELMCNFSVRFADIERAFALDFRATFAPELAALEVQASEGLVSITADGVEATPTGEVLIRRIAQVFDAYRTPGEVSSGRFSRAV